MTTITPIDPAGMPTSPAFAQAMLAEGGRTLYIGGQNGVRADGTLADGYAEQTKQALRNVLTVLAEVGADQTNVVKMTIHIAHGQNPDEGYAASAEVWGRHRTAVTVLTVAAVGRPGSLVEIDAIAVV